MSDDDRLAELGRRIEDADAKLRESDADGQPVKPQGPWDPFAERRRKQQAEREPATHVVMWDGRPIASTPGGSSGSWGAGTGRPSGPVTSPDAAMDALIRESVRWLRYGIPPERDERGPIPNGIRHSP